MYSTPIPKGEPSLIESLVFLLTLPLPLLEYKSAGHGDLSGPYG